MRSFRCLLALVSLFTFAVPGWVRATSATPTPTLTTPATGELVGNVGPIAYSLPVAALPGSVKVTFSQGGGTPTVLSVGSAGEAAGVHFLPFIFSRPTLYAAQGYVVSVAGPAFTDGTYAVTLSYQDAAGDPAASATSTGVIVDTVAGVPTIAAPVRFGKSGRSLSIDFTLPEAARPGLVSLTFVDGNSVQTSFTFSSTEETAGRHAFTIDVNDPTSSPHVASGSVLGDGAYDIVSLNYYDLAGNLGVAQFSGDQFKDGFTIDTTTQAPTLTSPTAGTLSANPMTVEFTLPEAALAGSVAVKFDDGTNVRTLHIKDGVTSLSFEVGDPGASTDVTSVDGGETIPDGTYTVTLSYQDALGNPANTSAHTGVIVDGTAPQITIEAASPLRRAFAGSLGDYTALANVTDVHGGAVSQQPAPGSTVAPGIQTITLTATDDAGNDNSANFKLDVRPLAAVHSATLAQGAAAPGRGAGGLPADAVLASFNLPATDNDGDLAYLAKWTGAAKAKGTGLFLNDKCLGLIGGDVPGLTGATFASFTDPVVDGGSVVSIAGLKGTPKPPATAVVSNVSGTSTLDFIARAGDIAPDASGVQPTGGATFKSFKAVAIHGGSIGIFAQLAGGTGPLKATAASDIGLWIKNGTDPLKLALREGQTIGAKTIKTLISFLPGADSPGQGRGWLAQPYGTTVMALVLYTDKSQALVTGFTGGGSSTFTETGKTAANGGPAIADATFASFGLPAMNDFYNVAFLGTLNVGTGGVTKADARGLFLSNGSGSYAALARIGKPSGVSDATFATLKDPVLAADNALAFTAVLKPTKLVKGPATKTLWWQPGGGSRQLLAQGGARPGADLPADAQWKDFTNLAIAGGGRGPVFAATLVAGKGGVTAKNVSGVWACDYTGAPRVLFRVGDTIGGKVVKSFTLLKATVGNLGVTRSINDAAQVVWLATFADKSTAIITTEVP